MIILLVTRCWVSNIVVMTGVGEGIVLDCLSFNLCLHQLTRNSMKNIINETEKVHDETLQLMLKAQELLEDTLR